MFVPLRIVNDIVSAATLAMGQPIAVPSGRMWQCPICKQSHTEAWDAVDPPPRKIPHTDDCWLLELIERFKTECEPFAYDIIYQDDGQRATVEFDEDKAMKYLGMAYDVYPLFRGDRLKR